MPSGMSEYFSRIGTKGGKKRLETLSPAKRKQIARKAAAKSAEVRRQRAMKKGEDGKAGDK